MDWAGWAVFGFVATAALTGVMVGAQMLGLTRLDLPLMLGTIVTEDPDKARAAGFFIHLGIGQGFALGYAAVFALLGRATWWLGGLLGIVHVAIVLTVLVPWFVNRLPRTAGTVWPQLRGPDPGGGDRRPHPLWHRARRPVARHLTWTPSTRPCAGRAGRSRTWG